MDRGIFITLEGPDGSGKSTQISFMKDYFEKKGIEPVFTREPGGTAIGEKIRTIILDKENIEMCSMSEALLYAASRAQHVHEIIKPALEEGKVVICDRFIDSSMAYQGYGRNLGDSVRIINEYAVDGCMPDLTFFMKISPEEGKSRINSNNFDRLEMEKIEFHNRVFKGYEELMNIYSDRFVAINGKGDKESVRKEIFSVLDKYLAERGI